MDDQYNINSIAEAVVNWGICDDFDNIDEYYQSEEFTHVYDITKTSSNFLRFFEGDFKQIISKHCNGNMSKEQFVTFVSNRCDHLGKISAYFGYIMPCAFMRETIYRFKNDFGCSNFFILAQECLSKFLKRKFKEFENDISWSGFMSYCKDINSEFSEKIHSEEEGWANWTDEEEDYANWTDEEEDLVQINIIENPNPTVKSTEGKDATSNTTMPLEASRFDRTNSNHMNVNRNNKNAILSKLPNGTFMPNTKSEEQLDLSKKTSKTWFESENYLYRTREYYSKNYICSSDVLSDSASNNTDLSEATVHTFKSKTKLDKTENFGDSMPMLHPEHGPLMTEENVSMDSVGFCEMSPITRNSAEASKEEFFVLYNILMPDDEFAVEVSNCIWECFHFDDEVKMDTS